ncbi:MAG: insulinase family protein, partial [Clostridia bacterium]|nr:insulinase family protein [Clostridia bacterium]
MSNQIKTYESELLGEKYYEIKHKSGLPIYVFPKEMSTTHALLAVKYGSIHNVSADGKEPPFPHGIAHFLEHKLFSNEDGSDSFEHFSAMGADANAYTSHARTVYLFSATERPAEPLAELIDFVTHPYFTAETVQKEQGIIAEEIRMCRDNPYDRCYYN